jgi:hypothetical protein
MKTKILTAVAILLAIPTYGISLVVWLFAKYKYDKFCATRVLINAAAISYNNGGVNEVRYGINNAALPIVFDYFGGKIINDMGNSVSGVLPNPSTGDLMIVTMSQISDNRLLIKATKAEV